MSAIGYIAAWVIALPSSRYAVQTCDSFRLVSLNDRKGKNCCFIVVILMDTYAECEVEG